MMCPKCQRYNPDANEECEFCGTLLPKPIRNESTAKRAGNINDAPKVTKGDSKKDIGVLMCLFLGLLGLIIGLLLYPAYSEERDTFLQGWKKCFVVLLIIGVVVGAIIGIRAACVLKELSKTRYYW